MSTDVTRWRQWRHVVATAVSVPVLIIAAAGCSEDSTAIRIKLVADPAVNTEAQVLAVVDRVELVFDATGSLGQGSDALAARDVDGDGEDELVFTDGGVGGTSSFPLYRLRPGDGMAGRDFTVTAQGTVGGQLAAVGQTVSTAFADGADLELSVPLDLRDRYRPPRVVTTLPQDGQQTVPPALGTVHVVFSKWIAPASLEEGNLTLAFRGPAGDEPVPGKWTLVNTSVADDGRPGERALASVDLGTCNLSPGTYVITAKTAITDVGGVGLDQRPATEAAEPFSATFTLPGTPADAPCGAAPTPGCTEDAQCNLPGEPPRYVCARDSGRCVPAPVSCDSVISCPDGFLCVDDGGKVACEEDPSKVEPPPPPPPPAPTCATANPCPDGYRCDGGNGDPFVCIDDSIGCNDAPNICPPTTRCNEDTGRCFRCEVYPSAGCEIECHEGDPAGTCPVLTECEFATNLCTSI